MSYRLTLRLVISAIIIACALPALGVVNVTVTSDGTDVTFTSVGRIELGTGAVANPVNGVAPQIRPDLSLTTGMTADADVYSADNFFGSSAIGTGTSAFSADLATGSIFGVDFASGSFTVPRGYVSNSLFNSTAVYQNQTYETLGILPGSYDWEWTEAGSNSLVFVFMQVLPEPPTGTTYQIDLTGTVSPTTTLTTAMGAPTPGDPVTVTLLVDPRRPDSDFASANRGNFFGSVLSATVTSGSFTYVADDFASLISPEAARAETRLTTDPDPLARMRFISLDTDGPADLATGSDGTNLILDLFNADETSLGDLDAFPDLAELNRFLAGLDPSSFGQIGFTGNKVGARRFDFTIDSVSATLVTDPATGVAIEFDAGPTGSLTEYEEDGFVLSKQGSFFTVPSSGGNPDERLDTDSFGIAANGGEPFDLLALDFAFGAGLGADYRVEGFFVGGGSIVDLLTLEDQDYHTHLFSGFENLVYVEITTTGSGGFKFDNIILELRNAPAVPEPGSVALLGLCACMLMRRRRAA